MEISNLVQGGGAIAPLDNPLTMAVVVFMTDSLQYSKSI